MNTAPEAGRALPLRGARDLERARPDDVWAAVRLDWEFGLRHAALTTALLTVLLVPVMMWLRTPGFAFAVFAPLVKVMEPVWYQAPSGRAAASQRTERTLRGVLPLSRTSVVRAWYGQYIGLCLGVAALAFAVGAALAETIGFPLASLTHWILAALGFAILSGAVYPPAYMQGKGPASFTESLAIACISLPVIAALAAPVAIAYAVAGLIPALLVGAPWLALCLYVSYRISLRGYLRLNL